MSDQAIYPDYFNQEHRQTLDALRAMMGDQELTNMLEGHSAQHSISLMEVIAQFATHGRNQERALIAEQARTMQTRNTDLEGQIAQARQAQANLEVSLQHRVSRNNPSRYIKLDVSKFSGLESDHILRWLLQISIAADAMDIRKESTKVAFAMSHLKGRAEAWAYSLRMADPGCFPSLDAFAAQLKKIFLPPNSDFRHRSRFLNATQGKQSIREFVQELRYIYACITDEESLPEATRVTVFMNGLNKGPARTELFRQYPKTFDEAVNMALSEDFSQSMARSNPAKSMDMDISSMEQFPARPMPCEKAAQEKRCFECQQPGHYARNCPHRQQPHRSGSSQRPFGQDRGQRTPPASNGRGRVFFNPRSQGKVSSQ